MICSDDFFLAYSLSIHWWLKGGDRKGRRITMTLSLVNTLNLKGSDRVVPLRLNFLFAVSTTNLKGSDRPIHVLVMLPHRCKRHEFER